ncbi:MAG: hypothetical protein QW666_02185 [Candidatus Woesearchaeota archaeon]
MGDKSLSDVLVLQNTQDAVHFFIDKQYVATFSEELAGYPGKEIYMQKHHFPGFIYLSKDFFSKIDADKHPGSDAIHLAKAFFQFNGVSHVCRVQFLPEAGLSGEHYHTLDEYIACLAGAATVRMSSPENDADEKKIILKQGNILHIPPKTLHVLYSPEGCITIPVKEIINGKRDHIYQDKSEKRMLKELNLMIRGVHHGSGNEMLCELKHYYEHLKQGEKTAFMGIIDKKLKAEKNQNIACILQELTADIKR